MTLPFSEYEKRFLLVEVLKASQVPISTLLNVVKEEAISPAWLDVCLPPARSVNACQTAFTELLSTSAVPFQFQSDYSFEAPGSSSRKRRREPEEPVVPTARELKPKPAANGDQPPLIASTSGTVAKKRGRPSNADLAARQALRGEVVAPPKKPQSRKPSGAKPPRASLLATEGAAPESLPEGNLDTPTIKKVRRSRQSATKNIIPATSEPGEQTVPSAPNENNGSNDPFHQAAEDEEILGDEGAKAAMDAMESTQEIPESAAEIHTLVGQSIEV